MQTFYGFDPIKHREKTEVRRAANAVGAAYSSMLAVSFVLQLALMATLGVIFGTERMFSIMQDNLLISSLQIVLSILMFTVPYIVVSKVLGYNISNLVETRKPKRENLLPIFFVGWGLCALSEVFTNIFASVLSYVGIEPAMPQMESGNSIIERSLYVVAIAVVPPLVEEFAMRGIVTGLLRRLGDGVAILLTAAIFGLMHANLIQIPFAFVAGLGLGFVAVKSGSLWPAVILHFAVNGVSVVTELISRVAPAPFADVAFTFYLMIVLILGVLGFVVLARREKAAFTFEKGELSATLKEKLSWFFSAPFIIISLVITAIEIIFVQVLY